MAFSLICPPLGETAIPLNGIKSQKCHFIDDPILCHLNTFPMKPPPQGSLSRVQRQAKASLDLKSALDLIETHQMRDCAARVVCEIECNPSSYGTKGQEVYGLLTQNEKAMIQGKEEEIKYYRMAAKRGLASKSDCRGKCSLFYPSCHMKTASLLKLATSLNIIAK
jgi:hypothetical protein